MSEARKKTGCENCMVAFMDENGVGFITPVPMKDLEELSYTYTYAEASNNADNVQNIYIKKPTGADISLTFSDVLSKLVARILGRKYSKGGTRTNVADKAVRVAILFKETYQDGSYKNKVFYNVKLSMDENSAKSEGSENIEFTPAVLTGKALPYFNEKEGIKGDIDYTIDSRAEDVDPEVLENFFKEVQFYKEPETEKAKTSTKTNSSNQ